MFLKELEVRNFKSFESLNVKFDDLNILIGANASGKSNFIRIFTFIRNIVRHDLQNAISMEGGIKYLRNINIGSSKDIFFKLRYDPASGFAHETKDGLLIGVKLIDATYEFTLHSDEQGKDFSIIKDQLTILYQFVKLERKHGENLEEVEELGIGKSTYTFINQKLEAGEFYIPPNVPLQKNVISPLYGLAKNIANPPLTKNMDSFSEKTLFLETSFFSLAHDWLLDNRFENIAVYDFDSKLSQKASSISGKTELEEDAGNLSLVLKNILANPEQKRMFTNLIGYLLHFIDDFKVIEQADKSLVFALREKHYATEYLPSFLLSEGTINLTALIIALYFTDSPILILEEPEKTIHPAIIEKMIELFREISENKQIIVTTHNPEIVKHAPLENLLLISRDRRGFSQILKLNESESVKAFMQNNIGVQDLYVQDLLGA